MNWPLPPPGGTIVACLFPYEENPSVPGPDLRPALIVARGREEFAPASVATIVYVAYGTGQRTDDQNAQRCPWELCVDPAVHPVTGLGKQTVFDFSRIVPLRYTDVWFKPWRDGGRNPRIGNLPQEMLAMALDLREKHCPELRAPQIPGTIAA